MTLPTQARRYLLRAAAVALVLAAPASAGALTVADVLDWQAIEAATAPLLSLHGSTLMAASPAAEAASAAGCPSLLDRNFRRLQGGDPQSLCQFSGKVLLIVNTASYCGYTRQYEGLEALYRKYRDRGLVVIGFPSNDFEQEPGSNKEIAEFCRSTYGVQFPMFEKGAVATISANALYQDLAKRTGQAPKWNFHKYVVDRTGTQVTSFRSAVEPDDREFVRLIEKLLAAKTATVGS